MPFRISAQAGQTVYNLKEFVVDTFSDITLIDTKNLAPGSVAFIIDTSESYMLNTAHEWIKVNITTNNGLGSGSGDSNITDVIYDGGEVIA